MSRHDLYRLDNGLVVDVQTDYLVGLDTRLVIPLDLAIRAPRRTPRLNPSFEIGGERYILMTQQMASVPSKWLDNRVASLAAFADDITEAIDVLLTGF